MKRLVHPGVFCTVAIVAVFSASTPVLAQSLAEPKSWTATGFIGPTTGVSSDFVTDNSLTFGLAFGYDQTSNTGFELELSRAVDVVGNNPDVDWSVINGSANFVYHFDARHVTPYATAGLGFERSNVKIENASLTGLYPPSSTEMAYNFGGGVKYKLNQGLIVRGDLRRFQAVDAAPDYWRLYGGVTFSLNR